MAILEPSESILGCCRDEAAQARNQCAGLANCGSLGVDTDAADVWKTRMTPGQSRCECVAQLLRLVTMSLYRNGVIRSCKVLHIRQRLFLSSSIVNCGVVSPDRMCRMRDDTHVIGDQELQLFRQGNKPSHDGTARFVSYVWPQFVLGGGAAFVILITAVDFYVNSM
jgi:hypothetical protein